MYLSEHIKSDHIEINLILCCLSSFGSSHFICKLNHHLPIVVPQVTRPAALQFEEEGQVGAPIELKLHTHIHMSVLNNEFAFKNLHFDLDCEFDVFETEIHSSL